MRITLHQLQVFQTVAELQSVTKTAQKLHMTQPAVSNIIKQLQNYFDCQLIEVVGRQVQLTQFGQTLNAKSKLIIGNLEDARSEIELQKGGIVGTIRVATVSTAKYFVPRLLGEFKREHERVGIKLTVGNREEVISRLEANMDDFVIMSHPPSTLPVEIRDFFDDTLVVICAYEAPYPKRKQMHLSDLQQAAWIMREEGSGTRFATERLFKQHRYRPNIEMEIGDIEAIKQAVIANMGISIVSAESVQVEIHEKLIRTIPVKKFPVPHRWYLVKNRNKTLPLISKRFYNYVNQYLSDT